MRISTAQLFQQGVNAILDQQTSAAKTQQQLSTGKRILSPADDPSGASQALRLDKSISQTNQFQSNSDYASQQLTLESNTLNSVVNLLQRAHTLAVQANNGTQSAQSRQGIAQEVQQSLQQLQALANTKDTNGQYIFGGYKSGQQPFTSSGGTVTYNGDQGQRFVQIGQSRQVAVSDAGSSVFMGVPTSTGGSQSIFKTLQDFVTSLQSNSPSATSITDINNALKHVLSVQTDIGSRQNAVSDQQTLSSSSLLAVKQNLSQIQDLNYTQAISQFQQQLTALQAAQQSFGKIQGLSLFNYLP